MQSAGVRPVDDDKMHHTCQAVAEVMKDEHPDLLGLVILTVDGDGQSSLFTRGLDGQEIVPFLATALARFIEVNGLEDSEDLEHGVH